MLSLENDDLLVKGRGDINLPQFPKRKEYRGYGKTVFWALENWVNALLAVNEVGGIDTRSRYFYGHNHRRPERLVLPATVELPLLVVESVSKRMQIDSSYQPNSNFRETGYLVPQSKVSDIAGTAVTTAPSGVAPDFDILFEAMHRSEAYGSSTKYKIGEGAIDGGASHRSSYRYGWGDYESSYSDAEDRKLRPAAYAILEQFSYSDAAFKGADAITVGEYRAQVCEQFDNQTR